MQMRKIGENHLAKEEYLDIDVPLKADMMTLKEFAHLENMMKENITMDAFIRNYEN